jgi:hypothetical protein
MKFQQLLKRLKATARKNNRKDIMIKKYLVKFNCIIGDYEKDIIKMKKKNNKQTSKTNTTMGIVINEQKR